MKIILLVLGVMAPFVGADEVRSYEVGLELLRRVDVRGKADGLVEDPFAEDAEPRDESDFATGVAWLGPVVEKSGFESRFFEDAKELRDCTKRVNEILGREELKAEAFYLVEGGRLIVKGGEGAHQAPRMAIEAEMVEQIKATLSVYEIPGAGLDDQTGFWSEVPEKATLIRKVSWISLPGVNTVVGDAKGGWVVESEIQRDAYDGYVETRLTLEMKLPGGGFSYQTGYCGVSGTMWAQEIGSLNGKTSLMLVSQSELIFPNGRRWADWILKEDGGAFLEEETLEMIRWRDPEVLAAKFDPESETRQFTVPPTFLTFIDSHQQSDDPFSADGEEDRQVIRVSVRQLLEENGITFREGDFVSYLRESSTLVAKLSPENMIFLEGIIQPAGLGPPEYHVLEFALIEGDDFRKGKLLKKMALPTVPGAVVKMSLGKDLAIQAEMQIDWPHDRMELGVTLTEQQGDLEKPSLRSQVIAQLGQPMMVQQSVVDGKTRTWVVTGRMKILEREVDALLKEKEAE